MVIKEYCVDSIAGMMGIEGLLDVGENKKAIPKKVGENLKVVSMQSLMSEPDQAVIWRGPAKTGVIRLPLGKEVQVSLRGRLRGGFKGAQVKLDGPAEGLTFDKGWIGRKGKGKDKNGKQLFEKGAAWGRILLTAEEPLRRPAKPPQHLVGLDVVSGSVDKRRHVVGHAVAL